MRYFSVAGRALLPIPLAALLTVSALPAQAQSLRPPSAERAVTFDALEAKAAQAGSVRVIVTLAVDWVPEGREPSLATQSQRDEIESQQKDVLSALVAPRTVARFRFIPALSLTVDAADLARLRASGEVVSVQEDVPVGIEAEADPLAPLVSLLSSSRMDDSTVLVGAPAAWAAGYDGAGYEVAVLDTGVQSSHPFLRGKVVSEACYSTTDATYSSFSVCPGGATSSTAVGSGLNCSSATYGSGCDHGTHVAGTAAGNQPAAAPGPTSGVARGASVVAIQVFSGFTTTAQCGTGKAPCALSFGTDQLLGLERVYDLVVNGGRKIVSANMSLGGGQYFATCDAQILKAAIDNLLSVGVSTVISSGNDGYQNSTGGPGCISTAVTVGSTTKSDAVSGFSNVAPWMDLFAPGSSIQSSVPTDSYAIYNGTSMAAPHVAGAFAVLKSAFPTETPAQLLTRLTSSGVGISAGTPAASYPRIQIDAALFDPAVFTYAPTSISVGLPVGGTAARTITITNGAAPGSLALAWSVAIQNLTPGAAARGASAATHAAAPGGHAVSTPVVSTVVSAEGAPERMAPGWPEENGPAARNQASVLCTEGQVIEQASNTTNFTVNTTNEYGQSFVAPCTGLMTSVTPTFLGTGVGVFDTVLRLYNGLGVLGTVLAEVPNTTTTPASGTGLYETTYAFAPVEVVGGQTYTWFLDIISGTAAMSVSQNDVYPGGSRWRSTTGDVANAFATSGDVRYRGTFSAPDTWLDVSATSGSVAAGASGALVLGFDATGLAEGVYTADIVLTSNDANLPTVSIPVTLTVSGSNIVAGNPGWRLLAPAASGMTVDDLAAMNLVQGVPGYYPPPQAAANLLTGYTGSAYTTTGTGAALEPGRGFFWYFYDIDFVSGSGSNSTKLPMALTTAKPAVTVDTPVALHADGDKANMLGNPFGVSLDVSDVASWPGASDLASNVVQMWSPNVGTSGSYETSATRPTLSPWQGFFAEVKTAGTLTIPLAARTTGGVLHRTVEVPLVAFELTDGTHVDQAAVLTFAAGASAGADRGDAAKLAPPASAYVLAAFATGDAGALRAVESRPLEAATVPLSVASVGAGSDLVLTWPRVENLPDDWTLTLRDTRTGTVVDLAETASYAFSVAPAAARGGDAAPASARAAAVAPRFELSVGPQRATADEGSALAEFTLASPRPNPARGTSLVPFSLAEASAVHLSVIDLLGREVAVLADGERAAGLHAATLDARSLAPGVYVVRLSAGRESMMRRLVVVR